MSNIFKDKVPIKKGDFYEDCSFHPVLCIKVGKTKYERGDLYGISLVDGTQRHCSYFHCGVVKLTKYEAINQVLNGPKFKGYSKKEKEDLLKEWKLEDRWWTQEYRDKQRNLKYPEK